VSLVFEAMGEEQINRTMEDYEQIKARLPPSKTLLYMINETLKRRHKDGRVSTAICDFRAGDLDVRYRPYPYEISRETLRSALELSGMRVPKRRRSPKALREPAFRTEA
jgi:hypothetical protein